MSTGQLDYKLPLRVMYCMGLVLTLAVGTGMSPTQKDQESYRLGPNDIIRVQVFGEDDLTVEDKIEGDGTVNFPLLGPVPVAGKTILELQDNLTNRLAKGYLRSPKVTVHIVRHRSVFLSGEVRTPGGYPYEEGLTVQKVLALAGGVTDKAERGRLQILRMTEGRIVPLSVEVNSLVLPDDVIVVSEGQKFFVGGEVRTPGRYQYEAGLTIQKALSMAGGTTDKSDKGGLRISRLVNGVPTIIEPSLEDPLLADDFLIVHTVKKIYVNGEVKNAGGYPYEKGLTVHKAVTMAGGFTDKAASGRTKVLRITQGEEQSIPVDLDTYLLPEDILVIPRSFF